MLDRMIARLITQRAYIERAIAAIGDRPGLVLEVGLGKGRTYDHLRKHLPDRDIVVLDGSLHAPENARPAGDALVLGDFRDTLPTLATRYTRRAILVHADIGSPDRQVDADLAATLGPLLAPLLAPGAIVLSDRLMVVPDWQLLDWSDSLPDGADWPYHAWQSAHV